MTPRLAAVAGVVAGATTAMCLALSPRPVSAVAAVAAVSAAAAAASEDVVRRLYTAFNARDADALVAHVSDDVRWMTVEGDTVVVETSGRDALRASMARYFQSTPTARSRIEALLPAGEFVTVHERVFWMQGAAEKTQSAVAVYRLRNEQIVSVWYFDVMP